MAHVRALAIVIACTGAFSALLLAQGPDPKQGLVLAAARAALGGEQRLTAVKTLTATGRTRQVRGDNLVPIEFEITCELPDKYVRKDEIPSQDSLPTAIGFNGDDLIQDPPSIPAQPDATRRARIIAVKQDFVRLTLGMFAASFSSYPLVFIYAGQAEAPQGKADVIDAKGAGNFAVRLFVDSETHLPVMVSWQAPSQGKPVEYRVYYADYRDVGDLRFPFRTRRAIAGETVEETEFDRFRINPKIDPKKFEVSR